MPGVTERVESYYRSILRQMDSGMGLPSERTIARELKTCRSTVRLVLAKLQAQGLLHARHGRGYYKS